MKIKQIIDNKFKATLVKLLEQDTPIKTTILLKGIVELLNSEITQYEEARQALLNKYGSRDLEDKLVLTEDRNVVLTTENAIAFSAEFNELSNKEVDVPTLSVQDLGDKVKLSYDDLMALNGLIV